MRITGIILAGGKGERFRTEQPKQFIKVAGKRVIEHTLDVFNNNRLITDIVIACHQEYIELLKELTLKNHWEKVSKIIIGGKSRQESSWIAINALELNTDYVVIHDAVRPLITNEVINNVIKGLEMHPAIDTVIPTFDTIVRTTKDEMFIDDIPERTYLKRGQTPQAFHYQIIKKAHQLALEERYDKAVDDCSLVLKYKLARIFLVPGEESNIKITHPIDSYLADRLFQLRAESLEVADFSRLSKLLNGQVIVIFGGTKGIGKSIAELSSKMGMHVYSFGSSKDVRTYDVIEKTIQDVFDKEGKINVVATTAGILRMSFLELSKIDSIKEQIDINLLGSINVCKASVNFMKNNGGHILLFTSSSYTRGRAGYTAYSASKAGLVNFVQGFAEEIAQYGIKVNAINPERTNTPLRVSNFGKEDEETLLRPETVAIQCLNLMTKAISGMVIDIKKTEEAQILNAFNKALI